MSSFLLVPRNTYQEVLRRACMHVSVHTGDGEKPSLLGSRWE